MKRALARGLPALAWVSGSLVCGLVAGWASPAAPPPVEPARSGRGWSLVRLDVDVTVHPEAGEIQTAGIAKLRLQGLESSFGPTLLVNTRPARSGEAAMRFLRVASPGARVDLLPQLDGQLVSHRADVRFAQPLPRGATLDLRFAGEAREAVRRMVAHREAAMADWSNAWLPFPIPDHPGDLELSPHLFAAPGRTTLHLPPSWQGLVDGTLVQRVNSATETVEVWETPPGIARGFVAGPYEIATAQAGGREIRVYLLPGDKPLAANELALLLGRAISAEEKAFGPLPAPSYSMVEFPRLPEQSFGAVSEQTHVIVQPPNLDYVQGNLQVPAHEAAHAWWGNAIGTTGPGLKWCSESLAEYGAILALEEMEGRQAVAPFLEFGRRGTDPYYSAVGYFALLRSGQDLPLAAMEFEPQSHALANSKGVWVLRMLRGMLGDDLFFATLRGTALELRGRDLTVDALRARFVAAAPEKPIARFFRQWLDRTGAPILDVFWHADAEGRAALVEIKQLQDGDPFVFDLDVGVTLADGAVRIVPVAIEKNTNVFRIDTPDRPMGLDLDPSRKVLIWRPEYGPRPGREIAVDSGTIPAALLDTLVGSYRFLGINKDVQVFARDGRLYMQPADSAPVRLIHESGGHFRVEGPGEMRVEFDLSGSPAPSFVSIEGGGSERYPAERVAP